VKAEIRRLAWQIAAHAEWHGRCGTDALPTGLAMPSAGAPAGAPATVAVAHPPGGAPAATAPPLPPPGDADLPPRAAPIPATPSGDDAPLVLGARDLPALRDAIGDCRRCRLAGGRTQVVFGVGDPRARLVFVGEGPGRDEDLKGEPFVGRAGALLTDIIEKGMRLRRADVYICNVVKCRPPENRNPEPDEVAACSPFLLRQIALVGPEVIVALGKFAAQTLLATTTPISKLRGRWFEYQGIPLMPTLHPAYLLRNPADKKLVWQDIKLVMARLGLET